MSRLRATAAQILPDCPLVVGFGGWGVLGSDLPADGEAGESLGRRWGNFPEDDDAEFWVYVTRWPTNGVLVMAPDTSFVYDGTTDSFDAQLAIGGVAVGTPKTVTLAVGDELQVVAGSSVSASTSVGGGSSQEHLVAGGATASSSASTGATVSTPGSAIVIGANSASSSQSTGGGVSSAGSHAVQSGNSVSAGSTSPSAVTQEHRVAPSNSVSASRSTGGAVRGRQPRVMMAARIQFTALAARLVS